MQNPSSRKSLANTDTQTPKPESDVVLPNLSPDEILAKCFDLLESSDSAAINLFLKDVHGQISRKLSSPGGESGDSRYNECAQTFYCVFNLLINLFKASKYNNLLINTSALTEFYFIFLNTFQEDHNLCFITEEFKLLKLYEKVHSEILPTKSHNQAPDESMISSQIAPEHKKDVELQQDESQLDQKDEIAQEEGQKQENLAIKLTSLSQLEGEALLKSYLSVDLLVVELFQEIFEKIEAKNAKEIVESIFKYYDTMSLSIFSYMVKTKPFQISLANKISLCAVKSLKWICNTPEDIQKTYLTKLASHKTAFLEFFFVVLGLNMGCVSQEIVATKIKLPNNIMEALHKKEHRERGRGSLEDFLVTISEFDLLIKADDSLVETKDLISMAKDILFIYRDFIVWPSLGLKSEDESSPLNIKLNLNLERLAAAILNFLEMIFHEGVSKDVQNDLIYMNELDILVFANSLVVTLNSFQCLGKAIHFMYDVTEFRKEQDIQEFWEKLHFASLGKTDKNLATAAMLISLLGKSKVINESQDQTLSNEVIMYFEELKKAFERVGEQKSFGDGAIAIVINKLLIYIINLEKEEFKRLQENILAVMKVIYQTPGLLETLIFSDTLMNKFLKEFIAAPYSIILFEFISIFYEKFVVNIDYFKTHGSQFFSKLKSFLDFMYKSLSNSASSSSLKPPVLLRLRSASSHAGSILSSPTNTASHLQYSGVSNDQIDNYRRVVQLTCNLIVNLICLEPKVDFVTQYLKTKPIQAPFNFNRYIFAKKSCELQSYFATTGIYEQMVSCLSLDIFQTRDLAFWFTLLTFCIIHQENEILATFSELGHHLKFYNALTHIYRKERLLADDILKILNCLFNLASNNEFYYLLESRLSPESTTMSEILENLHRDKDTFAAIYMNVSNEDFIYIMLKMLFEWDLNPEIKEIYLEILRRALEESFYNAFICSQGPLVEFLMVCLRRERMEEIKIRIAEILAKIFTVSINVSQLKSLLRTVRYNYHSLYPSFFETLISSPFRKDFVDDMIDFNSYSHSIKLVFEKIIKSVLSETEDNENFIQFSGKRSGIIIKNFNLITSKSFSILIQLRSENLKTICKKFLDVSENFPPDVSFKGSVRASYQVSTGFKLSNLMINDKHFETSRKTINVLSNCFDEEEPSKLGYQPRLFTLMSKNGYELSLYIAKNEQNRRVLFLECKNTLKKDQPICREVFDYTIKENDWYSLIFTYSEKNTVSIFINGETPKKLFRANFAPMFEAMDLEKTLVIGNALNNTLKTNIENFDKETSFQGQISNFLVYPFEITAQESEKIPLVSNPGLRSRTKTGVKSFIRNVFDGSKKKSSFDPEYLMENSLLNLNAFVKMTKFNVHKEIAWVSNTYVHATSQKKKFGFLGLGKEQITIIETLQIKSKGVFYLEKSKFEDVFFSIGDIDVFLLCIDLLSKFSIPQKAPIMELLCQIIEVLKLLASQSYQDETLNFLLNNGAYVLAQLIQEFIAMNGANLELATKLVEFFDEIPNTKRLIKYKCAHALFWRFSVWEACPPSLQIKVFERSLKLLTNEINRNEFKENGNIVVMLHYMASNLQDIKRNSKQLSLRITHGEHEEANELPRFRKLLLEEIGKTIKIFVKEEILNKELMVFFRYISYCDFDTTLFDALHLLLEIFKTPQESATPGSSNLKFQRLLAAANQAHLRELLTAILLKMTRERGEESPSAVDSRNQDDEIIAITLNLIDIAYFKGSSSNETLAQSQTFDRTPRPRYHTVTFRNDKEFFLKLFNYCFVKNMGLKSFQSFMELTIAKTAYNFSDDLQTLNFVIQKVWELNSEVLEIFMIMLLNLFKSLKNVEIFLKASNSFNLIYNYLACFPREQDGDKESVKSLKQVAHQVVQQCFEYIFTKSKSGMIRAMRICHLKSKECFMNFLKNYIKPILIVTESSFQKLHETQGGFSADDIGGPQKVYNLMSLMTYISVWVSTSKKEQIENEESEICSIVELLFKIFTYLDILYSTLPDIRLSMNQLDPKEMVVKMENSYLFKNGGVFFTMLNFLVKMLSLCKISEDKIAILNMLYDLLRAKDNKKSTDDKTSVRDLMQKIEHSNIQLMRYLKSSQSLPGYFDSSSPDKQNVSKPQEHVVYGTILATLLKRFNKDYKGLVVRPEQQSDSNPDEPKIPISLEIIVQLIGDCLIQGGKHIQAKLPTFTSECSLKNLKRRRRKDARNLIYFDLEPRSKDLESLRDSCQKDLKALFDVLFEAENARKAKMNPNAALNAINQDRSHQEFFTKLTDLCVTTSSGQVTLNILRAMGLQKSNKDQMDPILRTRKVFDFLNQNQDYIQKALLPLLKENCMLVPTIMHQMSLIYYDLNVISIGNNGGAPEELEVQGKDLEFEKALEENKKMQEAFIQGLAQWEKTEERNMNKVKKKWNFLKNKLLHNRGIWQVEEGTSESIKYKIDKAEDFLRRRMRLKKDPKAAKKEYLNASAYQQRIKSQRANLSNVTSPNSHNRSGGMDFQGGFSDLDHGDTTAFTPSIISCLSDEVSPMVRKKSDEGLGFNEIPKEEVLATIKEKAFDYLNQKSASVETRGKKLCEKIALKGAVYGEIEITESKYIIFSPISSERPDTPPYRFGALKDSFLKEYHKKKQWPISNISQVHARNYNLMATAIEIFIKDDGKTYFFNLYHESTQQEFIKRLKQINPDIIAIGDRTKDFHNYDFRQQWVEGNLSNFDYLMILNTFAGRSYNDINQYPVFPWIVQDYSTPNIDFNTQDPKLQEQIFRKLDTPMGAINPKKREDALEKFENWDETEEPKFHYGSHYSNAGSIINFLIRLEPFTSLNIELQSGKFDQADRLFYSIQGAWESCLKNRGDFRELVPEFFYLPEVLKNTNKIDFGITQTNRKVDDVELPAWAKTPEEFILKHKEALESEYVSKHLHEWIDLIFGYKQKGPEAEKAINVFRYLAYEKAVDLNKISDPKDQIGKLEQIFHLGQTPTQLFTNPHPMRKDKNQSDLFSFQISMSQSLLPKKGFNMNLLFRSKNSPIIHLSRDQAFIYVVFKDLEFYIIQFHPRALVFESFKWQDLKNKTSIQKLGRIALNDINPRNQFAMFTVGTQTYHVVGGYIDNSFKILKDGKEIQSAKFHKKAVTAVDAAFIPRVKQTLIAVGSKDCRVTVWKFDAFKKDEESRKAYFEIFYGHHNEITALHIQKILGIVISADKDGVVLIFCILSGKLLRSIYPHLQNDEFIKIIQADENGFVILVTSKDKIYVYNINGSLLKSSDKYGIRHGTSINSVLFYDRLKPYILISTKMGSLIVLNFLKMEEIRNLNHNLEYTDKTEEITKDVEQVFKGQSISTVTFDDKMKFIFLGFENGNIGVLSKSKEDCVKEFRKDLTDLGIEI